MKKFLSLALAMILVVAAFTTIFTFSAAAVEEEGVITPDTSWYDETKTELEIADAADFLGFAVLLQGVKDGDTVVKEPVTFKDKVVKLTANIDVNPGWNAKEYIINLTDEGEGSDMTFAIPPANEWPIKDKGPVFLGTLDGQDHYVAGIYAPFNQGHDAALFGSAGSDPEVAVTIKNIAFLNSYVELGGCRVGGLLANGAGPVTFENIYNDINIYSWRKDQTDLTGAFMGYATYSGTGNITFKDCVYAGTMVAHTMMLSGFIGGVNAAGQTVKYEDCLMTGTMIGGSAQAAYTTKNKGIIEMDNCVVNGTFDSDKAYLFARDLRSGEANSIVTRSNLYVEVECKGIYQLHQNNTVDNPIATKVTVENLKNIKNNGFDDWTATLEDGGIKMPITTALAETVKAFKLPTNEEPDVGGNENDTTDTDNTTGDDTNDTTANTNENENTTNTTDNKTSETSAATADTSADGKKGCGGIIGTGVIAMVAVTGAALEMGAKKKED